MATNKVPALQSAALKIDHENDRCDIPFYNTNNANLMFIIRGSYLLKGCIELSGSRNEPVLKLGKWKA